MTKYFNSLQVFVAAALSLVIFIGMFWAEQANFSRLSTLSNPFEDRQLISERVVVNGEYAESWLHQSGEVFLLLPGTKFNLLHQARELEEGTLFVNTNFQDQALIDQASQGFKPPFVLADAPLDGGFVRIGPAVVGIPQGIAILRRDLVRQETEIYAYDHPVNLYLPGAQTAFLIPAGYKALLKESRADLLGALYYTKLKKELKLQPLTSGSTEANAIQNALLQGLEQSNVWQERIIEYAQQVVPSWDRFAPNSFMGASLGVLGHIQRYYAVGIDKPYKADYRYNALLKNVKNTYFSLRGGDSGESLESAEAFVEEAKSADWARFFVEYPQYSQRWADFARLQRVWFYYIFPENAEEPVLRPMWGPTKTLETMADVADNYYLFEKYYTQNYRSQAQVQLEFIKDNLPAEIRFENDSDIADLSQIRRQLGFLLQSEPSLRNDTNFTLYTQLVEQEKIKLEASSEVAQEIRLEVAQELLFFLKDLLDSSSRQDMAIILLRSYRNLKVATLAENLGRSVFSAQERETLNKIQGLGTLSEEKLAAIRESNRAAADALALFDALNQQPTEVEVTGPVGIQTEADFLDLLVRIKVLTQGMEINTQHKEDNQVITFSQTVYEGYSLQGTFQTSSQSFSFLKLGTVTESRATASNIEAFLNQMLAENKKQEAGNEPVVTETGPNNYTSTAKIQRRNILTLLEQKGINVALDDVLLTNVALTEARVERGSFHQQYLLSFDFDLGPPIRIRNVTAEYGRNTILLPGQVFKMETLEGDLIDAIEAKFKAAQEEE